MKNLLILLFSLFTGSLVAQADAVTKFFKSYVDDDRFSTVYISPKMFQLVSKIKINDMDADLQQLLKNIQGYITEYHRRYCSDSEPGWSGYLFWVYTSGYQYLEEIPSYIWNQQNRDPDP